MNRQIQQGTLLLKSFITALVLLMALGAQAAEATGNAKVPPDKLITNLFNEVNARIQQDKDKIETDKGYLATIGEQVLVPYVSFETMAKQILGKNWRKITPDQRQRYTAAFKDRVSSSIVAQYDPEKRYNLEVTGFRTNDRGDRAAVNSVVTEKQSGKQYQISYMLYIDRKTGKWQVYDVSVEGVSVLQSFKSASAEDFKRNGIEYMIAQLEKTPDSTSDKTEKVADTAKPEEPKK